MKGQGGDNDEDNNDDDDNDGDDDDGDDGDDDNSAKDDGGGRWRRQRRGRNLFSGIYSIPSFRSLRNRSRSNCYGVQVPSIEWSRFFQLMLRDRIPWLKGSSRCNDLSSTLLDWLVCVLYMYIYRSRNILGGVAQSDRGFDLRGMLRPYFWIKSGN